MIKRFLNNRHLNHNLHKFQVYLLQNLQLQVMIKIENLKCLN